MVLKSLLSRRKDTPPPAAIPAGERVYAIGDVHGRLDCLDDLLARIDADDAARGPAKTTLVLVGDLIDRGPDSAGVVARAMELAGSGRSVRVLQGNHEELLLSAMLGERQALAVFDKAGGRATLLSYGVDPDVYDAAALRELPELMLAAVPEAHRDFLASLEDVVRIGDYVFVHAGIRPGVPIEHQKTGDLRWIREPFLSHRGAHGVTIVHGHTISDDPELLDNRIGIDTGAYRSGRLTALALEGTERWTIATALSAG